VSQTQRSELDPQIDALYGLPPGEFTAERDALARRLRREGDRESADVVRGLAKPSAAAWLVNQLARRHPEEVGELLEAGAGLRRAHQTALAGGGAPALAAATDGERRAVGRLLQRARELEGEGAPSEATLARVRETLHAAASDEEARELIERGRLVRERRAVGLGPLAFAASTPSPPHPRPAEPRPQPARLDAAAERDRARRLAAAQRAVEAARRDAEAARVAHDEREEDHRLALAEREAAEEERERARQAVRRAEEAVDAARGAEKEARARAREERRRRDAAAAALLAAEDEVQRLDTGGPG
jgi:hypothetical protein